MARSDSDNGGVARGEGGRVGEKNHLSEHIPLLNAALEGSRRDFVLLLGGLQGAGHHNGVAGYIVKLELDSRLHDRLSADLAGR